MEVAAMARYRVEIVIELEAFSPTSAAHRAYEMSRSDDNLPFFVHLVNEDGSVSESLDAVFPNSEEFKWKDD